MNNYTPKVCEDYPGWYEIPGYSKYAANKNGFILNKKLGNSTEGGVAGRYRKVSVYKDGDSNPSLCYTHDLICRAFHGKPEKGYVVGHKDNDRLNNKPSNLKWVTQSDNIQDMWDDGLRVSKESKTELSDFKSIIPNNELNKGITGSDLRKLVSYSEGRLKNNQTFIEMLNVFNGSEFVFPLELRYKNGFEATGYLGFIKSIDIPNHAKDLNSEKMPFATFGNGDYFLIDLNKKDSPVYWYSHEEDLETKVSINLSAFLSRLMNSYGKFKSSNENLSLSKILFHGSHLKFDIVEPRGVNMGTRLHTQPKLSSYWWETHGEALGWAIYQILRRVGGIKCWFHIPSNGFIVFPENKKVSEKWLLDKFVYVYSATVNRIDVGFGSSPDIKEYTVDTPVAPNEIDAIRITKRLISEYLTVMSKTELASYINNVKSGKYSKSRGVLLSLILDAEKDAKRHDPEVRKTLGLESNNDYCTQVLNHLNQRLSTFDKPNIINHIYIFGSTLNGSCTNVSDVDLLVSFKGVNIENTNSPGNSIFNYKGLGDELTRNLNKHIGDNPVTNVPFELQIVGSYELRHFKNSKQLVNDIVKVNSKLISLEDYNLTLTEPPSAKW